MESCENNENEEICVHEAAWGFNVKGNLLEKELTVAKEKGDQTLISELEAALATCRENEMKMYEEHWAQEKAAIEHFNEHPEVFEKLIKSGHPVNLDL